MKAKIHKILPQLLKENSESIASVAKATGIPKSSLFDWTTGKMPRDLGAVKRVAHHFGVSFHYLLFGEEDPNARIRASAEEEEIKRMKQNSILQKNWIARRLARISRL